MTLQQRDAFWLALNAALDRILQHRELLQPAQFDPAWSRGACFKNLEPDRRYKAFLRTMNLPE